MYTRAHLHACIHAYTADSKMDKKTGGEGLKIGGQQEPGTGVQKQGDESMQHENEEQNNDEDETASIQEEDDNDDDDESV
jgi:hypothetical protein